MRPVFSTGMVAGVFVLMVALAVAGAADTTTVKRPAAAKKVTSSTAKRAATSTAKTTTTAKKARTHKTTAARKSTASTKHVATRRRRRYVERFYTSSFTDDQTAGDVTAGEDPVVRAAALAALGNLNGPVLAIDPNTGRILAMVNQRMALSSGAEPCSTIKLSVALSALEEGLVKKDTPVNLGGHYSVDLTYALAKSVNQYFEVLGREMGFEKVKHYANEFGLGELAGYKIPGEQLGVYPDTPLPDKQGGVGRMCSFGESISMTPLQLGALVSAIANGGTLYYLQHPTTPEEAKNFMPMVKRTLNIGPVLPEIHSGHDGRGGGAVWHGARAGAELQPVSSDGKDGDLLEQWNTLWVVRRLCGDSGREDRDGNLYAGRAGDVWTGGGEADGRFLPDAVGEELLPKGWAGVGEEYWWAVV